LNPKDGPLYGNLFSRDAIGTQHYHGLLLSIQRRAATGTISANYTWSHCLGVEATANDTGRNPKNGNYVVDPNNRRAEVGNCGGNGSDRRQVFNLTGVFPTPQFQGAMLRKLATGWQLGGILRASTGDFLSVVSGQDRALNGFFGTAASANTPAGGQRATQILGNPYGDRNSISRYLNTGAFAQPALGTFGNMGPYGIEGPGYWQIDMALSRTFQIREMQKLEFRAEAFNLTNRFIPMDPNVTLSANNTFGQILSARDARIMQFALRYAF
jgi:hypothetical protein